MTNLISIWDNFLNEQNYMNKEMLETKICYYSDLFNAFNININTKAIEIGAGHGINTEIFVNIFNDYIATEPNLILFNELKKLKNKKYNKLIIENIDFENINIEKIDLLIFTFSFQYIENEICVNKINELLHINGFLLILLPFEPFMTTKNEEIIFNKNCEWRDKINKTIKLIIEMKKYRLIYFTKEENYIILLKKIE